jgi:hypothetical protein
MYGKTRATDNMGQILNLTTSRRHILRDGASSLDFFYFDFFNHFLEMNRPIFLLLNLSPLSHTSLG